MKSVSASRCEADVTARLSTDGEPMVPRVTLLDLITVVSRYVRSEAELLATVVYMVNARRVGLCGNFKNARFDLSALRDD
jgi:hypothetical protein